MKSEKHLEGGTQKDSHSMYSFYNQISVQLDSSCPTELLYTQGSQRPAELHCSSSTGVGFVLPHHQERAFSLDIQR